MDDLNKHTRIFVPTFLWILIGQIVSLTGTQLTGFSLGVWVFQRTGSPMFYSFVCAAVVLPRLIVSPLAGVFVDWCDRRWALVWGNIGSGACSLALIILFLNQQLTLWNVIICTAVAAVFSAVEPPALTAATTLLAQPQHLGKVNGMLQLGTAVTAIIGPAMSGFLLPIIGLGNILLFDLVTFLFSIIVFLLIRIPQPIQVENQRQMQYAPLRNISLGWQYIRQKNGLLVLSLIISMTTFTTATVTVLLTPLILSFENIFTLGLIASIAGVGGVTGSIAMIIWGGPRKSVEGILGFALIGSGFLFLGALRPSVWLISIAAFGYMVTSPIINSCNKTIWQRKVPPNMQGRVFSFVTLISEAAMPFAYLVAGPLAEMVFEPIISENGLLAGSVGCLLGTGPGRGIAFLFCVLAVVLSFFVVLAYQYQPLRNVEHDIPDYVRQETKLDNLSITLNHK